MLLMSFSNFFIAQPGFDDQHLSKLLGITLGANGVSEDIKQQQSKSTLLPELHEYVVTDLEKLLVNSNNNNKIIHYS